MHLEGEREGRWGKGASGRRRERLRDWWAREEAGVDEQELRWSASEWGGACRVEEGGEETRARESRSWEVPSTLAGIDSLDCSRLTGTMGER